MNHTNSHGAAIPYTHPIDYAYTLRLSVKFHQMIYLFSTQTMWPPQFIYVDSYELSKVGLVIGWCSNAH